MHGLPHGAILQQGVPTSALEPRRAQTRVQTIEKKERGEEGEQQLPKNQKININFLIF